MRPPVSPRRRLSPSALPGQHALVLALFALTGAPAMAADAPADADLPKPKDANTLSTVTVTAEKTRRSLGDTATSVAVFDAEQLQQRPGLANSRDLLGQIANVTATGTGNFAPAVRGVDGTGAAQGIDAFIAGSRQRLGVQIDGRPASFNEVVYGGAAMWDVAQVELLRGAQSTLQGRNAVAGTLAIKTNDPSWTPDASVRLLGGNYGNRQGAFYATGPIGSSEQFAYRIALDDETHNSFAHGYQAYPSMSDPGKFESKTVRAKLLYKPKGVDDFTTLLTVNHADHRGPQTEGVVAPYDQHVIATPAMPVFEPKSTSLVADTHWGLSDRITVENLLSGTYFDIRRYARPHDGISRIGTHEWVWEPHLRFNKTADSRWSGLFGAYVYGANQHETLDVPGNEVFNDRVRTAALFGEGTLSLSERFDLTLGARYERETHRREGGDASLVAIDIDRTYKTFLPKLGLAWHASEHTVLGATVGRGYNGGGAGVTFAAPIVSYSYGPEYVWTYEAYFRSTLANGRLQLTGNVFRSDYKNMQLPFNLSPDPTKWSVVVRNAPRATTQGAEFGARWLIRPGLQVYADAGLLDTDVTRDPGSGIEGNQLANAPHRTADLGLQYHNASGLELSLSARYSDGYFSTIRNLPQERVRAFLVANAQAGYWISDKLKLFGYVTNLFDRTVPLQIGATTSNVAVLMAPRTYGLGLQAWL